MTAPTSEPTATVPPASSPTPESAWAYRLAFNIWLVLFLLVICVGLLNYLGTFAKSAGFLGG